MLRWVPLWQTMTSSGRLQIFVKTFTKEFQIFSFKPSAFFVIIVIIIISSSSSSSSRKKLYEFPLYHSLNIARSQHPVWSEVLRGSEILWEGGSGQQYANCKSIREAADIPCILPYPLDRYARSGAIHINRWPRNRELQKPLKWWHPPFPRSPQMELLLLLQKQRKQPTFSDFPLIFGITPLCRWSEMDQN